MQAPHHTGGRIASERIIHEVRMFFSQTWHALVVRFLEMSFERLCGYYFA